MAIPTQDGRSVMIANEEQESIKLFFNACSCLRNIRGY